MQSTTGSGATVSGLNPQADKFTPATMNALYSSANVGVLLQTANLQVFNPDGSRPPAVARVIQPTSQTKEALSLHAERTHRMSIKTFGLEQEEEQD